MKELLPFSKTQKNCQSVTLQVFTHIKVQIMWFFFFWKKKVIVFHSFTMSIDIMLSKTIVRRLSSAFGVELPFTHQRRRLQILCELCYFWETLLKWIFSGASELGCFSMHLLLPAWITIFVALFMRMYQFSTYFALSLKYFVTSLCFQKTLCRIALSPFAAIVLKEFQHSFDSLTDVVSTFQFNSALKPTYVFQYKFKVMLAESIASFQGTFGHGNKV